MDQPPHDPRAERCVCAAPDGWVVLTRDEYAALLEAGKALCAAFVKHRTATHEIKSKMCLTCQESDAALDAWDRARGRVGDGGDHG